MENTVIGLIYEARKLCPVFFPSIFPQSFNPQCLKDLISVSLREIDSAEGQPMNDSFRLPACFSTEFSFTDKEVTITQIMISSDLDSILSNPQQVMQQLQSESFEKTDILSSRFFELNEYPEFDNVLTQRHQFNKIYSILYAIRTLLSNIPGLRIKLGIPGEHFLPLQSLSPDVLSNIKLLMRRNNDDSQIVQKTLMTEEAQPEKKKKSKRKRSCA